MFKNALRLYVYPYRDPASGKLITAENLLVKPNLRHLCACLLKSRKLFGFKGG